MEQILGNDIPTFIGVTLVLAGGAAMLMGSALARTWRPFGQGVFYGLLLGLVSRFISFSLFGGELLSLSGYIVDSIVIILLAALVYRATLARRMVAQYPWLYERASLFGWRLKAG
ncbi:DUF6867 family protein [Oceanibaculum pacificum]|uniref:DUF6867 domain-containing protein n=1 Tax=Oceanibaculum pacificum TaxID=580166 RepID=A0A154W915_9PROT|nr:hypothetical protein [Oceanibaculum pacificum]KZD10017.1 hypothetical protein AUP43_06485 [Oceanibaculum pacificum]